jgi:glutamate-1-semialdehyde 2,1-aminomutase
MSTYGHPIVNTYAAATTLSRKHFETACQVVSGGTSRGVNYWDPHPIYAVSGKGSTFVDLDGREYSDFLNNYTALLHGHADPGVTEAITGHLYSGLVHSVASPLEAELAALLVDRVPSVERVRFTASGTEAVMYALRVARAATGRTRIAKIDGGFHGTYDGVSVSIPPLASAADPAAPPVVADGNGIPPDALRNAVALPYNDIEHTTALIEANAGELAAVIVEPVLCVGGMIPAEPAYLRQLRELCDRHGIVLIFDEVVTLRLGPGGAQQAYGVLPDLTVMSKIIGGGLPLGAIGGRRPLMDVLAPAKLRAAASEHAGPDVYQRGTFHGYPIALAAGTAALSRLSDGDYDRINRLGERIRSRLSAELGRAGLPVCVSGAGSLLAIHLMPNVPTTGRDMRHLDTNRQFLFFLAMMLEGFMIAPRGLSCLSTPMGEHTADDFVQAVHRALARLF